MKPRMFSWFILGLLTLVLSLPALARPHPPHGRPGIQKKGPTSHSVNRPGQGKAGFNRHGSGARKDFRNNADVDGNGNITHQEKKNYIQTNRQTADVDGNGQISGEEKKGFVQTQRSEANKNWEFEADSDGNGTISVDELNTYQEANPDFIPQRGK